MMRQQDYEIYRSKYPNFIYNSYSWIENDENITITYDFEIEFLTKFKATSIIMKEDIEFDTSNKNLIDNLVFNLGMVELISYWKAVCSKNVIVKCGYLNEEQISWFKKLYYYGLGELFYTNGITNDIETFM